jgi:hypothetical protein
VLNVSRLSLIVVTYLLSVVPVLARDSRCAGNPKVVAACYVVHGRATYGNGTPALRIWPVGTRRILGVTAGPVADDADEPIAPKNLRVFTTGHEEVYGDFEVCPFTVHRKGYMQMVCVESASKVFVKHPDGGSGERLMEALAKAEMGAIYVDDGAGDGTVTDAPEGPDPRVKAVVDLRNAALPLLIRHLDDPRPTHTSFRVRPAFSDRPATLAHVALDILTHMTELNDKIYIPDCADDGLGACFQPGYYFRPDASVKEMKNVKDKWQKLYRRGGVVFRYPPDWPR